eukprot:CAMPEP_0116986408 /NCGR_PEP_ID=MMETSP0467-20121206/62857_1 /TAXON_ID=283647 /ORGANISM="Mesodinium pulex, Strain SPMC105" /LENGTH=45 /DNA_ID= /DNA_START= /DNA_END= /DNA_ORIENTATION=
MLYELQMVYLVGMPLLEMDFGTIVKAFLSDQYPNEKQNENENENE